MNTLGLPVLDATARDLLLVLFKRKWSILIILTVAALSAFVYLWFIREDVYTASAKILVKLGSEQAPPPTLLTGMPQAVGYRYQEVNTETEIMQSVDLLSQLIDEFKLDQPPAPKPPPTERMARIKYQVKKFFNDIKEAIDELMIRYGLKERMSRRQALLFALTRTLNVHGQKDSNIFMAELTMPYRGETAVLLNELVKLYFVKRMAVYKTSGVDYFRDKEQAVGKELAETEDRLQGFEMIGPVSMLGRQQEQLLQQIASAETAVREAQVFYDAALQKVGRLDEELAKEEPNFGTLGEFPVDSFPQNLLRQVAELQRERERLRMTELDSGEKILNNRSQFQSMVSLLSANLRAAESERRKALDTRKQAFTALSQQLAAIRNRQSEVQTLERKAHESQDIHLFYRKKLEETLATQATERQRVGNVSVVQWATEPIVPTGMRKTYLMAITLVAAIFLALAWVTLAEFFDDRLYTVEDTRKRLPGAGVIAVAEGWWPLELEARRIAATGTDAPVLG